MCRLVKMLMLVSACSLTGALIGTETKFEACPYVVAIKNIRSNVICGGSILNNTSILTSAVCMMKSNSDGLDNYTVYTGSENLNLAKAYKIKAIHDFNFNRTNYKNDIVVLELKEKITLRNIVPVMLPPDDRIPMNLPFSVCSFGNNDPSKNINKLRYITNVQVMDNKKCREAYKGRQTWLRYMYEEIFCSRGDDEVFCYNDQGSALVIGNVIYGIVYSALGCFMKGNHALFLSTGKYLTAKKVTNCNTNKQWWLCGNFKVDVGIRLK